jgi:hypothetical protein
VSVVVGGVAQVLDAFEEDHGEDDQEEERIGCRLDVQ